jgi:hypothetical protein
VIVASFAQRAAAVRMRLGRECASYHGLT